MSERSALMGERKGNGPGVLCVWLLLFILLSENTGVLVNRTACSSEDGLPQSSALGSDFSTASGRQRHVLNSLTRLLVFSSTLPCFYFLGSLGFAILAWRNCMEEEIGEDEDLKWLSVQRIDCCFDKTNQCFNFKWSWVGNSMFLPPSPFKSRGCLVFLDIRHGSKSWNDMEIVLTGFWMSVNMFMQRFWLAHLDVFSNRLSQAMGGCSQLVDRRT